jgi:hypothetical protein
MSPPSLGLKSKLHLLPPSCWFLALINQPWRWGNVFLRNVSWFSTNTGRYIQIERSIVTAYRVSNRTAVNVKYRTTLTCISAGILFLRESLPLHRDHKIRQEMMKVAISDVLFFNFTDQTISKLSSGEDLVGGGASRHKVSIQGTTDIGEIRTWPTSGIRVGSHCVSCRRQYSPYKIRPPWST